ncbi:MAG: type II toxin-antitoxin system VapC family toxin [Methylobacterium mesophilicum]|nr:type II toxin-antitoxin system VapC family toxin [Methylobacterium mesophilicum]
MIIDASAILAIMLKEQDGASFKKLIASKSGPHEISAVNYLEVAIRVDRFENEEWSEGLDPLMALLGVDIAPVTADQAVKARQAYRQFGKGNHPARLNLGDCFAYALSKARSEPLLYKGDDFRQTDVEAAA